MNIELGSSLFEKEKPTCPYILHFRSQTQLYLAFAKDWLRLYMTTKETSTVNGSQLGNLLNTNQLCLQETIGFYKEIWWGFLRIVTSLIQFWGFVVSTCLHCISGIAKSQHHAPPVLALNNCITWLCPLNFSFFCHDLHPVNCGQQAHYLGLSTKMRDLPWCTSSELWPFNRWEHHIFYSEIVAFLFWGWAVKIFID